MTFALTVSATIPARPRAVCDAWIDAKGNGRMTGGTGAAGSIAGSPQSH